MKLFLMAHAKFYLMFCLLFCLGCSSSNGKLAVKGTVTFKGVNLAHGNIQFFPLEAVGGESAGAMIKNGTYEIPGVHGLSPGRYKVVISCAEEVKTPPKNFKGSSLPTEEKLPPEFSSFQNSTQVVQVTAQGKNVFDFLIP
jgi:hypothetical protein